MNIQRWIGRQQPGWKELDALLKKTETKGLQALQATEIRRLASLYRSVSADLARARTNKVGNLIIQDLQALATRAYSQIYQGSRRQEWQAIWQFYRWGFPAVVQQTRGYIALATGLFVFAGVISWWLGWRDPSFISLVVPESMVQQVRDRGELWVGSIVGIEPFASSQIMTNNIKVSFAALAGGMTGGLLTAYMMLFNGLLIGTVGALVGENNLALPFWAFVFPHGSLELPAIFLAGGAGFLLARALLFPGKYSRPDALKLYGAQAAQLAFGIVPLLVIAGTIEGFFSPNPAIPDGLKYLTGMGLFALLLWYFSRKRSTV